MEVFVEAVRRLGPVLDVGRGPGTVTAYLAERGVDGEVLRTEAHGGSRSAGRPTGGSPTSSPHRRSRRTTRTLTGDERQFAGAS
jgi:hypothetical protein